MPTTVGWVALLGVLTTMVSFVLGFTAQSRLTARRMDELAEIGRRPNDQKV